VKAGGEDGFNVHFHDIEDEFKKLADVVKAISNRMDQLAQKPVPKPVATTLTPVLNTIGAAGWELALGEARKPAGATGALGAMSVDLPDGATIQSLRAIGENGGAGGLSVVLRRQKLDPAASPEPVVGVPPPSGGPFDNKGTPPDATRAVVDTDTFRYYIAAQLTNAGANDTVALRGFQIMTLAQ
jgi:hypothetical protein